MSQACLFETGKSREHDYPRTHVETPTRMPPAAWRDMFAMELTLLEELKPATRGECHAARREIVKRLGNHGWDDGETPPCPWVRCRYHLHVDVEPVNVAQEDTMFASGDVVETHRIKVHESASPEHTCMLDAVDELHAQTDEEDDEDGAPRETRGGLMTDTEIAERLNISDEEVRKIHNKALAKLAGKRRLEVLR